MYACVFIVEKIKSKYFLFGNGICWHMSDGQFVVLLVPSTKNQSSLVNSPDEEKLK